MVNKLNVKIERLSSDIVSNLINTLDESFACRLRQVVNIDDYSVKLSNNATFVVAKYKDEYVGVIAYYYNEVEKEFYIPYVCVKSSCRKLGIADLMMNKICFEADNLNFNISLEVRNDNLSAINLYKKYGFESVVVNDAKSKMIRLRSLI